MDKRLEKWTSFLALVFGALALVLAFQANRIARNANEIAELQLSPNMVLVGVSGSGGGGERGTGEGTLDAYCWSRVQLANVGGASTSITGFSGTVSFLDEEIKLEKYQSNWIRSRDERLSDALHTFNVTMELAENWPPNPDYDPIGTFPRVSMPIEIAASETINLLFVVRFVADPPFHSGVFTYQSDQYPTLTKSPMMIGYQLEFSDGSSLPVPQTDCQWFNAN